MVKYPAVGEYRDGGGAAASDARKRSSPRVSIDALGKMQGMKDSGRLEIAMLTAIASASVASGISPASRTVWLTEMFWAWGLCGILAATWRRFKFSALSYGCFFVWCMIQAIGAHWTFELVPMDWLKEPLGLVRNPYDRIAHFTVGWFALPLAELYWRTRIARSAGAAMFFAVATTVAMAGLWELVEWQYAVIDGGEAGAAFLGSQGDEWDAQKDILCDTLGAICAIAAFRAALARRCAALAGKRLSKDRTN